MGLQTGESGRSITGMATFSTDGWTIQVGIQIVADPAMNSYTFFEHQALYARSGQEGVFTYTPTYDPAFISGNVINNVFPQSSMVELLGAGLAVQTSPFAITAGTVTGFSESFTFGFGSFASYSVYSAMGFSIDAVTFWNLANTGQWRALWELAVAGDDTIYGGDFAVYSDFMEGGSGNDWLSARAGDDNLWGNAGSDLLYGGDGNDVVVCNDWQTPSGTGLWSIAEGGAGDDHIYTGGYGHGSLDGGDGSDWLWGGPDMDVVAGGAGIDYLAGGLARDVFEVTAAGNVAGEYDFIRDFEDGVDYIKLPAGGAWYLADSAYGAIVGAPRTGFYLVVQYATAAMVSDQIYYA
jgi:Ca2+-binding RTX toxin-like protein